MPSVGANYGRTGGLLTPVPRIKAAPEGLPRRCFAYAAAAAPLPAGWTSVGNCGTNTAADGEVTPAPGFASYQWISTRGSPTGGGTLPVGPTGQETNGLAAHTPVFTVNAGDKLDFFFNYITSDGAAFIEYAWAGLFDGVSTFDSYLFTARTTPSGNTMPGFGLPGPLITPPSHQTLPTRSLQLQLQAPQREQTAIEVHT